MRIILPFLFSLVCQALSGQNPVQNFTLTNVTDGSSISLDSYAANPVVAVIFTSNACPYDGYYSGRLKDLITAYQGKIQFLLINSYVETDEDPEKMKSAIDRLAYGIPYLADKAQVALQALGAKKSPEVFLLKNVNGRFTVVFSGPIDDNPQMPNAVSQKYLQSSIDKVLAGQKIDISTVRTIGCTIRKK